LNKKFESANLAQKEVVIPNNNSKIPYIYILFYNLMLGIPHAYEIQYSCATYLLIFIYLFEISEELLGIAIDSNIFGLLFELFTSNKNSQFITMIKTKLPIIFKKDYFMGFQQISDNLIVSQTSLYKTETFDKNQPYFVLLDKVKSEDN